MNTDKIAKLEIAKVKLEAVMKYSEQAWEEVVDALEGLYAEEEDVLIDEDGRKYKVEESEQEDCSVIRLKKYVA